MMDEMAYKEKMVMMVSLAYLEKEV